MKMILVKIQQEVRGAARAALRGEMGYVKGCDIGFLDEKKISREDFAQGFDAGVPVEQLRQEIREMYVPFVNSEGKEQKYTPCGRVYALYKKIDKVKRLIAVVMVRRVAEPRPANDSGKKTLFAESTDRYELAHFYRQPGFEAEATYFEETLLNDMRQAVGSGDVCEVRWGDWRVRPTEKKKAGWLQLGQLGFFAAMTVIWGTVFKNWGLGICYGLIFSVCYSLITGHSRAEIVPAAPAEAGKEVGTCRS